MEEESRTMEELPTIIDVVGDFEIGISAREGTSVPNGCGVVGSSVGVAISRVDDCEDIVIKPGAFQSGQRRVNTKLLCYIPVPAVCSGRICKTMYVAVDSMYGCSGCADWQLSRSEVGSQCARRLPEDTSLYK